MGIREEMSEVYLFKNRAYFYAMVTTSAKSAALDRPDSFPD
jgi:hypothetical protein